MKFFKALIIFVKQFAHVRCLHVQKSKREFLPSTGFSRVNGVKHSSFKKGRKLNLEWPLKKFFTLITDFISMPRRVINIISMIGIMVSKKQIEWERCSFIRLQLYANFQRAHPR